MAFLGIGVEDGLLGSSGAEVVYSLPASFLDDHSRNRRLISTIKLVLPLLLDLIVKEPEEIVSCYVLESVCSYGFETIVVIFSLAHDDVDIIFAPSDSVERMRKAFPMNRKENPWHVVDTTTMVSYP